LFVFEATGRIDPVEGARDDSQRNQPTLRAGRFDPAAGEVPFEFVRASNLAGPDAGHMRRARYRLDDRDHFTTE
jgi:hypothetical protein